MLGMQIILLSIILLLVPTIVGTIFAGKNKEGISLPFVWVSGQILLWAGFLAISIPLILLEKSFSLVVTVFGIFTGVLVLWAIMLLAVRHVRCKRAAELQGTRSPEVQEGLTAEFQGILLSEMDGTSVAEAVKGRAVKCLLWFIFGALLLLQLVLTVCMSYEEGDDAFYLAISTITADSDTMYFILPYTGLTTGLDARHGLAPFPIWVAYLARISGMPAISVAQVALPVVLVVMAYAIYYLIARQLFTENKENIPFFLILTELMVLFGGYSVYSAENFLLVRASQGKAVIANIILPFLLYLMLLLLKKLQKRERAGLAFWLLLAFTMIAGCLCSTLGTMLTCMLLGIVGVCAAVCYRNGRVLLPMALCCVIPAGVAFLYFMLG